MKRIIYALLMAPIALCVAYGVINFGSDIIHGNLNLVEWLAAHKMMIAFVACYLGLTFIWPLFKKV